MIETISDSHGIYAYVVRSSHRPVRTDFVTPPHLNLQAGHIVYAAGSHIAPHSHPLRRREIERSMEVLVIRKGRCTAHIFNVARAPVADVMLEEGDILILVDGGHGFTMHADTIMFEVKQGPYDPAADKIYFHDSSQ